MLNPEISSSYNLSSRIISQLRHLFCNISADVFVVVVCSFVCLSSGDPDWNRHPGRFRFISIMITYRRLQIT